MDVKTIIVTGANSGIGYQTSLGLAQAGHTVVMFCRNQSRGATAQRQIIAATGNQNVDLIVVDLSSQQSIRAGVAEFLARYITLDVLINNAANFDITQPEPILTDDGIETIFATNHLGPFLLTHLLLPLLQASAPARVINIASKGLLAHPLLNIEFDNLNGQRKFSAQHAYYHSKLAQIMFTYDLADRLANTAVAVNCIRVPAVRLDNGRYDHVPAVLRTLYQFKMRFAQSPVALAETYIRLATAPEFATSTGQYVDENCRSVKSSKPTYDREIWQRLWTVSKTLTGLRTAIHT